MTTRADVVAEAREWLGTPWIHQASLKGIGCDCIGFPVGVGAELGLPEAAKWKADVRFRNYGRLPLPEKLLESCGDYLDPIKIADAGLGDLLVLTFATQPMHFAIISSLDPMYIIHAYLPDGGVVEHVVDEKWRRRILRAFRLRGVD